MEFRPFLFVSLYSKKYEITEETISSYRTRMMLTIKNFNELDAGIYTCISSNTLGRANSTIRLYGEFVECYLRFFLNFGFIEVKVPTTEPTTVPTTTPSTTTTRRTTRGEFYSISINFATWIMKKSQKIVLKSGFLEFWTWFEGL